MLTRGDDPPEPPAVLTRGDFPPEPPVVLTRGDDPPEPPVVLTRGDDPPEPPVVLTRGDFPPEPRVVLLSRRALDGPDEVGAARIAPGGGHADRGNEVAARVLNAANLPLADDQGRAARGQQTLMTIEHTLLPPGLVGQNERGWAAIARQLAHELTAPAPPRRPKTRRPN